MDGEGSTPPDPPINGISEGANVIKETQLEEFTRLIKAGKTVKELQEIFGQSRTSITDAKRKYGLVGLSPNSKKLNRELGSKVCPSCNKELPFTDYYSNGSTNTGKVRYKTNCKYCENSAVRDRFYNLIEEYLSTKGTTYSCSKCGDTDVYGFLHFHHIDPSSKSFELGSFSKTVSINVFIDKVVPELDKCILLCPSCHVREHLLLGQK